MYLVDGSRQGNLFPPFLKASFQAWSYQGDFSAGHFLCYHLLHASASVHTYKMTSQKG